MGKNPDTPEGENLEFFQISSNVISFVCPHALVAVNNNAIQIADNESRFMIYICFIVSLRRYNFFQLEVKKLENVKNHYQLIRIKMLSLQIEQNQIEKFKIKYYGRR